MQKRPWSRGEKAILVGIVLALVIGVGWSTWLNYVNADPVVHVPTPKMPSPNGFDYLVQAGNNSVEAWPMPGSIAPGAKPSPTPGFPGGKTVVPSSKDPDLGDPKIMSAAEQLLQQNQPALSTVRQGLQCQYLTPPARSFSAPFPYLAKFRSMARIASFQASVDFRRGDIDGGVSSALLPMEMGVRIPSGGLLIHALVGMACEAIGRKPLWTNLDSLNAVQCRRVIHDVDGVDRSREPFVNVIREEKWFGQASLMEEFRRSDWKADFLDDATQNGTDTLQLRDRIRYSMIGKRRVMSDYTACMDAAIDAASGPYGTKPAVQTPTDPISDTIIIGGDMGRYKFEYTVVEDRLLMTACALRAYKLEHGAYPSTLQALVPGYLPSVPVDPFTAGAALKYKSTGRKYVLYSVGPDMKDDGGMPIGKEVAYTTPETKGDIVAGVNL